MIVERCSKFSRPCTALCVRMDSFDWGADKLDEDLMRYRDPKFLLGDFDGRGSDDDEDGTSLLDVTTTTDGGSNEDEGSGNDGEDENEVADDDDNINGENENDTNVVVFDEEDEHYLVEESLDDAFYFVTVNIVDEDETCTSNEMTNE